jgi:MFS family permease
MIYPLVPAFLLTIGGGAAALGWLEGIAETVAALVKIAAGRLSDRTARRKPLVVLGYGISTLARPLFALATSPVHAVAVRALDRVGKGLRGPPRDAMVAGAVDAPLRGHAFGFHRMMDNFGGVLGPIIAFALLHAFALPLRTVFAASIVPGVLAVMVAMLFLREPPRVAPPPASRPPSRAEPASSGEAPLPPAARRYIGAILLFSLAASGDLFLLHRMTDLGLDQSLIPVAWVSLQLAKGLLNVPGGRASDRFGRRRVLALAWLLYAATYAGFGIVRSWPAAWLLLAIYAAYYGLAEGGQRALLAEYVPPSSQGRAYGVQLAVEGLMVLPANVLFGIVYARLGAAAAFCGTGALALAAAVSLFWVPPPPKRHSR